jgi:hypothetical protein
VNRITWVDRPSSVRAAGPRAVRASSLVTNKPSAMKGSRLGAAAGPAPQSTA